MHCAQLGPLPQVKGTPGDHFMDLCPLFPQGPLFLNRILEYRTLPCSYSRSYSAAPGDCSL